MNELKAIGALMCMAGFGGSCGMCAMGDQELVGHIWTALIIGGIGFVLFVAGRLKD